MRLDQIPRRAGRQQALARRAADGDLVRDLGRVLGVRREHGGVELGGREGGRAVDGVGGGGLAVAIAGGVGVRGQRGGRAPRIVSGAEELVLDGDFFELAF